MTLYKFNLLERNDQLKTVYEIGTFIDNHVTTKERCNLYAIDLFFIELTYNSTTNSVTEIKSFKTGYLLDKYSNIDF